MELVLEGFEEISFQEIEAVDGGINWGNVFEQTCYYAFAGGTGALGGAAGAAVGGPIGARVGGVIGGAARAYVGDLVWDGIH